MRTRRDVWTLTKDEGDWPAVLTAYRQAVIAMRGLDAPDDQPPSNPISWRFQAAIHGLDGPGGLPVTSNGWSACQHGSWFFMPWHRMYLLAFENIVQHFLDDAEWSLPYWYAIDPDDATKAVLPPAFRDNDSDNSLFTTNRSAAMNGGAPLLSLRFLMPSVLDSLSNDVFSTDDGTGSFGGGRRDTPAYSADEPGILEGTPHGAVHTLVGNDFDASGRPVRFGWMGAFGTAALDPVFWLHHANIDRLWQVWLDADPARTQPADESAWTDTRFTFPAPDGGAVSWSIGEVLDLDAVGYRYESTELPSALRPPTPPSPDIGGGLERMAREERPEPEVVGARTGIDVSSTDTTRITLHPSESDRRRSAGRGLESTGSPQRTLLRIEGLTGTVAAPAYLVYVNLPDGASGADRPDLLGGTISTFGVPEASVRSAARDGSGLTRIVDITEVRRVLEDENRWNQDALRVTFEPLRPDDESLAATEAAVHDPRSPLESLDAPAEVDVHAARISVVLA